MTKKDHQSYEELHSKAHAQGSDTLNKLRAGVLGANDGIVSTASVVMGVAGATNNTKQILIAAIAAAVAGALSMAVGEYVSVSSQSDAEKSFVKREKDFLKNYPNEELSELTDYYQDQGISEKTAHQAAAEVTETNALKAHVKLEMGLDLDEYVNPWSAAISSLISFSLGSLIPILAVIFAPINLRPVVTIVAVLVALFCTGYISANIGNASKSRAIVRVIVGGLLAMVITYYVGKLFGTAIGN